MSSTFRCGHERRRQLVRDTSTLNGIDWVELVTAGAYARRELHAHCIRPLSEPLPFEVRVEGDVRSLPVRVSTASISPGDGTVLVVRLDARGDDGEHRLRLVPPPGQQTVAGFDPQLCEVEFSFQVGCCAESDCAPPDDCAPERREETAIDYMARDAASLRRLMLDRLSLTTPSWRERNPADLGVALVELFAHVGDRLSYYQDAVATEAYLGTARLRTSVRRHARLVDYALHEGCNARAWVFFHAVTAATVPAGTRVLTSSREPPGPMESSRVPVAMRGGAQVFETMHDVGVAPELNSLSLYTWDAEECVLPRGATGATLQWISGLAAGVLQAGHLLLLEEVLGPSTGRAEDADPSRRHVVRLRRVGAPVTDPLHTDAWVREVEWDPDDALPFDLTISARRDDTHALVRDISVARGNVALADHGCTQSLSLTIPSRPAPGVVLRLPLDVEDLTCRAPTPASALVGAEALAASKLAAQDPRKALPALSFTAGSWVPKRDLLASRGSDTHMVVETERGRSFVRFGDDTHGRRPEPGAALAGAGRVGSGRAGNIAADSLANFALTGAAAAAVAFVRNPLPARGGVDPEPVEQARRLAPLAFRRQERAVTLDDWVAAAERHPEVQRAAATQRWTGAWHTVFLTIDRKGGGEVDAAFRDQMLEHLDRFRLAGCDVEVDAPHYVPVEIAFQVCVEAGRFRADVARALQDLFSSRDLPDGRRGLFHPDNLSFGQPIYLSPLVAEASRVPGVVWVRPVVFRRMERPRAACAPAAAPASGAWPSPDALTFSRLEIAHLGDRSAGAMRGHVSFAMQGGL